MTKLLSTSTVAGRVLDRLIHHRLHIFLSKTMSLLKLVHFDYMLSCVRSACSQLTWRACGPYANNMQYLPFSERKYRLTSVH